MFSKWKYAAIVVAIGAAVASALIGYNDAKHSWVPVVLGIVAVISALFAPPPTKGSGDVPPSLRQ